MPNNPCTVSDVELVVSTIQGHVDNLASGSVICLAAGSVTWTSALNPSGSATGTKYMEIRGAGTMPERGSAGQTVIYVDRCAGVIGGHEVAGGNVTISNIKFTYDENSTHTGCDTPNILGWSYNAGGEPWIVHHNDFELTGVDTHPKIILTGAHGGVIYRNRFVVETLSPLYINTNVVGVHHAINDDGTFWDSETTQGSADSTGKNNLYVETNYFEGFNVATDRNTSSRMVWRFNEMNGASTSDHGLDSSSYGERHGEFYGNTYVCNKVINLNGWIAQRGGTLMAFNNIFPATVEDMCNYSEDTPVPPVILYQYKLFQCEEIAGWPGSHPDTYPVAHQTGWGWIDGENIPVGDSTTQNQPGGAGFDQALEPIYSFNNTNNTGTTTVQTGTGANQGGAYAISASSKASAGTISTAAEFVCEDQQVAVFFADLVGAATPTISDDLNGGHTWTALKTGTNGSLRLSGWTTRVTATGRMTPTVNFCPSGCGGGVSTAARAIAFVQLKGTTSSPVDKNPDVITDNSTPYDAPATGSLTQANELVLGYFALNGPTVIEGQGTPANDYINVVAPDARAVACGSASTLNTIGINGTSGGAATDNVTIAVTWREVASTSEVIPQITNTTTSRNGLTGIVTFKLTGAGAAGHDVNDFLQENREWYQEQGGGFDGTVGTGSGPRASRPMNCTAGVAWWSTDQGGNWDTTNGSANDGALDKCTATNTWTNNWYVPKAYPHTLADVISGGATDRKTKRGRGRGRH